MSKLKTTLQKIVGGIIDMADFKLLIWNDYKIRLQPTRNDIRSILGILPFFWNNELVLDTRLWYKERKIVEDNWEYVWELVDLEGDSKKGDGIISITQKEYKKNRNIVTDNALPLGYLHPNKHYQIYLTLRDSKGDESPRFMAGTFTLKDKDEYQMQSLILITGIGFAFILFVLEMGIK